MRLTIRCIIAMMGAAENSLEELCQKLRANGKLDVQQQVDAARRNQREARKLLAMALDRMIDTGEGE